MTETSHRYPLPLTTSEAFREGFFAFREGIQEEHNPFPFGAPEYKQWRAGWYTAKREKVLDWRTLVIAVLLAVIGSMSAIPQIAPSPTITGIAIIVTAIASVALRAASGGSITVKFAKAMKAQAARDQAH